MLQAGLPYPLGATAHAAGVNFALVAPHASQVELCLFDASGQHPLQRLSLPACSDGVWHGDVAGATPGLVYGYRVHGPWAPHDGQRFNPAKLLLDPYAREIVGRYGGEDNCVGHQALHPAHADTRDNATVAMKARVASASANAPHRPRSRPAGERVLYELHVRGHTMLHPEVPVELRGSYAGLAQPAVLDHLQQLGVTTLSLMPVQQRADEQRLQALGLSNYWGYSSIGWFAPETRYWSGRSGSTPASEFRALSDAVHARGMELVIDVVYNHSGETDEWGPTLSLRGIDNALYYHLRPEDRARYQNWTGCGNCLNFSEPRVVQLVMDSLRHWVGELGVDGFRFDLAPVLGRGAVDDSGHGGAFDPRAPLLSAIAQDPLLARALMIAEPWDIGPGGYQLGGFPPGWLEWNDQYRDTQRGFWLRGGTPDSVGLGDFAHRLTASSAQFAHSGRAPLASVNFITAHDGFTLRDLVSYAQRHNLANGESNRDGHGHNLSCNCGVEGATDDAAVLAQRTRLQRALLTTLLLSQGTPMLLAGDEIGHSQGGNNNAYCQDNATTWLDWAAGDRDLSAFVGRLTALRRDAAVLRSAHWWPANNVIAADGANKADGSSPAVSLRWLTPGGTAMTPADWAGATASALAILFPATAPRTGATVPGAGIEPARFSAGDGEPPTWLVLVNASDRPQPFTLPPGDWQLVLASDVASDPTALARLGATPTLPESCIWLATTQPSRTAAPLRCYAV